MKRVFVVYLKVDGQYTDGQSLTDKEGAMMPSSKAQHYLERANERGLNLDFEAGQFDVEDKEAEDYKFLGYPVVALP